MIPTKIHQLLHGYRRGHELLVGSIRLPAVDGDLVTRLSDLSGTLSGDAKFSSYLTAYPLPSGTFYALARTWPDKTAPREGCVLTHTLLIPTLSWASSDDPFQFGVLLTLKEPRLFDEYKVPLIHDDALLPERKTADSDFQANFRFRGPVFPRGYSSRNLARRT